jgi:UrcA family protein
MRKILIPVLAAASVAIGVPAAASTPSQVVVTFDDLDIATPDGRSALDARIATAVEQVCGKAFRGSLTEVAAVKYCQTRSLEDAMAQVEAHLAVPAPRAIASAS